MKCEKLSGTRILSCTANQFVYIPSLSELTEHCATSHYDSCPYFLQSQRKERDRSLAGQADAGEKSMPVLQAK